MRGSRLVVCLVASVSALVIAGCSSGGGTEDLNGMTRQPRTEVGNVSLPNENPKSRNSEGALKGSGDGLMLVYFGFTNCPDVCPTTLADLRLALEDLDPEQRGRLEVGMVTVDPERDTGEVLNGYLSFFFPEDQFSSLRTTDEAELARVEKVFGASHRIGKKQKDGSYDVDHSALLYAVDSDGVVEVEWPFGTTAADMRSDIEQLLDQRAGRSGS
jgi:protein SCO1/2